jgi:plastocyanin
MRFSPVTLTIKAGDSVVFENRGPDGTHRNRKGQELGHG